MTIHKYPSQTAKYFVIVFDGKLLTPVLKYSSPRLCSFYGTGHFCTTKKDAYDLAKYLHKTHPNRIYMVQCLNYIDGLAVGS